MMTRAKRQHLILYQRDFNPLSQSYWASMKISMNLPKILGVPIKRIRVTSPSAQRELDHDGFRLLSGLSKASLAKDRYTHSPTTCSFYAFKQHSNITRPRKQQFILQIT